MMKNVYALTGEKTLSSVAQTVENYLNKNLKMESQTLTAQDGSLLVQARGRHDGAKQWVGMDKAITVHLTALEGQAFQAEIGKGQWLKKSLVMTVSMVVLWPLFVTSSIGFYKQSRLAGQINQVIQRYLADLPITAKEEMKKKKEDEQNKLAS